MNWYKQGQMKYPQDFDDRNILNRKIHFLQDTKEQLERLSDIVFQDGIFAKSHNFTLANSKQLTSHPKLRKILLDADRIALDSPWKFAALCWDASDEIIVKIKELEQLRKNLIEKTLPYKMKGWVDRHG